MAETELLGALGSGSDPGSAEALITRLVIRRKRRTDKMKIEYKGLLVEFAMPRNMAGNLEIIQVGFWTKFIRRKKK